MSDRPSRKIIGGDFSIVLSEGEFGRYPIWCELRYRGGELLARFSHHDLRSLRFTVDEAMRRAKLMLKDNAADPTEV